jgi:phosphatidylserine/phosphatidylglycerophosphate/cardiolipin synthase-like enzyme
MAVGAMATVAAGCSAHADESEEQEAASTEDAGLDPYDYATWKWNRGTPGCGLSRIGQNVERAVRGARHNTDIMPGGRTDWRWVTMRNVAGPALLDSNEMFPALRTLIARAQHEVDLQWHVINEDSDGFDEVVKGIAQLNAKLESGETEGPVTVRIVSPAWIFKGGSPEKFALKIKEQVPAPSPKLRIRLAAKKYFGLATMHVKMGVVDGVIVHAGGGNLSNAQNFKRLRADGRMASDEQYKQLNERSLALLKPGEPTTFDAVKQLPLKRPEHDSAYIVKGQIGQAALAQFDQMWNEWSTSHYDCSALWTGGNRCRGVEDKVSSDVPGGHVEAVLRPDLHAYGVPGDACVPMIFMAKKATENIFNIGGNNPIAKGFYAAFDSAETTLRISSPNINDKSLLELRSAVSRFKRNGSGTVRVLEPIDFNWQLELVPFFGGGENVTMMLLLKALAGPGNLGPTKALDYRWHSLDGRRAHRGWGKEIGRHIKYYSVDGQLAIIGSTNLDKQSMHRSREIAIAIDDATVTRRYDSKIFDPDFKIGAKTYDFDETDEAGKAPATIDEPSVESTDASENNPETGAAKDGPPTESSEDALMAD